MDKSETWYELAREILKSAKDRISVRDFEIQSKLAPVSVGKNYLDIVRVVETLIEDNIIEIKEDKLRLKKHIFPSWLNESLMNGNKNSWDMLEILDNEDRYADKIDRNLLEKIGLEGEIAVIAELKNKLSTNLFSKVKHISLKDDTAGFDIYSPSILNNENETLIEVKTSSNPGRYFNFYISKNEATVASRNEKWKLVAVLKNNNNYNILGYISYNDFSDYLPKDISTNGKWQTAKIKIPKEAIRETLP